MDLYGIKRQSEAWKNGQNGIIPDSILESFANSKQTGSYKIRELYGQMTKADGTPTQFDYRKWKWLAGCPYTISDKCCHVMKKAPAKAYMKQTKRLPIMAMMASESRLRTQMWLHNGCNGFDMQKPVSNPMAFWTEQDVLLYVRERKTPIASVYGEVITDDEETGQINFADLGLFELDRPTLHTTGCNRTGCVFCGFGCHLEKPGEGRFERLKKTHPKLYNYVFKPWDEGGLGYKKVIDWINEHGNLDIRY